ncbi:MAG TPA: GNAT family N-acetyltransferase, partial [Clostridia bacterium]
MIIQKKFNNLEIIEGGINNLDSVYIKYEKEFPACERKSYNQLEQLMLNKKYKLFLLKQMTDDIIGYAFVYEVTVPNTLWLDYISIGPEFQNKGYGTLLFNTATSYKDNLGTFIEIEIPENEQQERRKIFYERLGAKRLPIDYMMPTEDGGYPLYLYFKPFSNSSLFTKALIKESIASAFLYIHSDIPHKNT